MTWRPMLHAVHYREVDHHLATLEYKCGVTPTYCRYPEDSAAWIISRYKWWNDKLWHQHKSASGIYIKDPSKGTKASWLREEPTLVAKVAALLPDIDYIAWDVAKQFKTVEEMVKGDERRWRMIPGVGPIRAQGAIQALRSPK